MKTLKIIPPSLPAGVIVTSTSWYVNTKEDFTGTVLLENLNNTTDLFSLALDFNVTDRIYAKAEMNLSNNGIERSDIIQLVPNADNKPSSLFVYAPKVSYVVSSYNKNMVVNIPEPKMFYYTSAHVSTTWRLVDTAGVPFYERERDVDNLLSITIDEKRYEGKNTFTIEALYNFEDVSIDVIGRANVLLNIRNSDVALSVSSISTDKDNLISILGLEYDIVKVDIQYEIGGVLSETVVIERGITDSFVISSAEAVGGTEVVFNMTVYTLNGTIRNTITLPILTFSAPSVKLMTSTATMVGISTILDIDGLGRTTAPISNGVFVSTTNTEEIRYSISNDLVSEDSRAIKTYDKYFMTSDLEYYARDLNSIYKLDPLTLNIASSFFSPISKPASGIGISDYKGDAFLTDANGIEHEVNVITGSLDAVRVNAFDYYIRITDTLTFAGSSVGDYAFEGNNAISLPGSHVRVDYIRTPKGVLAVAFSIDKVDLYYLNSTGFSLSSSISIVDANKAIAAYDVSVNTIYIIHKI